MITDKDIQKLTEVFATREEVVLGGDYEELKQGFRNFQEMKMLSIKVDRHERWILQIADKLGLQLES